VSQPLFLFQDLPFLSGRRFDSRKQCPLTTLHELTSGNLPAWGVGPPRQTCGLRGADGKPVAVRQDQILLWVSVGKRNQPRSDAAFPAILDTGCNETLVISDWHLEEWARSARYQPAQLRITRVVSETVANTHNTPHARPRPATVNALLGQPLQAIRNHWQNGQMQDWLAVVESDLWLGANEPGERDELRAADAWCRVQLPRGIVVRCGAAARPPLLGMRALAEGVVVPPRGSAARLGDLKFNLPESYVSLTYL
jgi:hypothetical protein